MGFLMSDVEKKNQVEKIVIIMVTEMIYGIYKCPPVNIDIKSDGFVETDDGGKKEQFNVSVDVYFSPFPINLKVSNASAEDIVDEGYEIGDTSAMVGALEIISDIESELENFKGKLQQYVDQKYENIRLIQEFKDVMPYLESYEDVIFTNIPDISRDDFIWLCQKMENLKEECDDDTINMFRVCRTKLGEVTPRFKKFADTGCCKNFHGMFTNEETGNKFIIGFNYNHVKSDHIL